MAEVEETFAAETLYRTSGPRWRFQASENLALMRLSGSAGGDVWTTGTSGAYGATGTTGATGGVGATVAAGQKPKRVTIEVVTRGIQTAEREVSVQTDPFSPEVTADSRGHELMKLKDFRWGERLPVKLDDLFFFEELLEKEAFEDSLPPLTDESAFVLRRKLMEEQETKDWLRKEEQLKKQQTAKLQFIQSVLVERERMVEAQNYAAIEQLKVRKAYEKSELVAKLQKNKAKILRKIFREEERFANPRRIRDIAAEYQDFASRVYARFDRDGQPARNLPGPMVKLDEDISALKEWLPDHVLHTKISQDDIERFAKRKLLKLERQHHNQLEKAKANLLGKSSQAALNANMKSYASIQNVQPRPNTPFYSDVKLFERYAHADTNIDKSKWEQEEAKIEVEEDKHLTAYLLQRLIRGRALQNQAFDGKEKRLALIEELLIVANVHELDEAEEEARIESERNAAAMAAKVAAAHGAELSAALDELSLEVGRAKSEETLRAVVRAAEEERERREAEEAGRRQAEQVLKRREDRFFEEVSAVAREQAEELLGEIFEFSSSFLAKKEAVHLTTIKERKFLKYVSMNENNHEVLIKDFMHCFLLKNVNTGKLKSEVKRQEKALFALLKEKEKKTF